MSKLIIFAFITIFSQSCVKMTNAFEEKDLGKLERCEHNVNNSQMVCMGESGCNEEFNEYKLCLLENKYDKFSNFEKLNIIKQCQESIKNNKRVLEITIENYQCLELAIERQECQSMLDSLSLACKNNEDCRLNSVEYENCLSQYLVNEKELFLFNYKRIKIIKRCRKQNKKILKQNDQINELIDTNLECIYQAMSSNTLGFGFIIIISFVLLF